MHTSPRLLVSLAMTVLCALAWPATAPATPNASASTRASTGSVYTASVSRLTPRARVVIFVAPARTRDRSCCGIAVGGVRVVPRSGRLLLRFRWPSSYRVCKRDDGRACVRRRWRDGQTALVGLRAPVPRTRTLDPPDTSLRVALVRVAADAAARRTARRAPRAQPSRAPLTNSCDSPWMTSAGSIGAGFGFEVSFAPTQRARYLGRVVPGGYEDIWADLQRCVAFPDVSYSQLDSMYNQMVCHVLWGVLEIGGDTWDFEAWRPFVTGWRALFDRSDPHATCNWDHGPSGADSFAGHIVQWSGDQKAQKTAWLVVRKPDGRLVRNWIPSAAVYGCLKDQATPGPDVLAASFLERYLPDEHGVHVSDSVCGPAVGRGGGGSVPAPVPAPSPSPGPAPSPAPPKPTATNLVVVVYGGGHVGVAFDVGWQAGRDPVTCHFFRDGVEVFTAQCGTHSSKQFYGVPPGTHRFHATVSDRFGVYSRPTSTIVRTTS